MSHFQRNDEKSDALRHLAIAVLHTYNYREFYGPDVHVSVHRSIFVNDDQQEGTI